MECVSLSGAHPAGIWELPQIGREGASNGRATAPFGQMAARICGTASDRAGCKQMFTLATSPGPFGHLRRNPKPLPGRPLSRPNGRDGHLATHIRAIPPNVENRLPRAARTAHPDEPPPGLSVDRDFLPAHDGPPSAAALQPAAREPCPPQPGDNIGAAAHDLPDQTAAVVLDHQRHGPLVDAEVVGRHPPAGRAVLHPERLVE
jgi:hypothetical protein